MANLANPILVIDNETIEIRPDTFRYKTGAGDLSVRTQQAGNRVTTVKNVNATTQMSMVGFELNTTAANIARVKRWLAARPTGVAIQAFDEDNSEAFNGMCIVGEPEISGGSEGIIPIEFQGDPIV